MILAGLFRWLHPHRHSWMRPFVADMMKQCRTCPAMKGSYPGDRDFEGEAPWIDESDILQLILEFLAGLFGG